MASTITNSDDIIDSRDFTSYLDEIREIVENAVEGEDVSEARAELAILEAVASEAEKSSDWGHGEALIRESYFVDYIREMISDCYDPIVPKERASQWPYRHVTIDYEAAAEEAKQNYFTVDFDGITYYIRA